MISFQAPVLKFRESIYLILDLYLTVGYATNHGNL